MNDAEKGRELERLQRENERLRQEQELSRQWLKLRYEFLKAGEELPPPIFLDDPSKQLPQRSQTVAKRKLKDEKYEWVESIVKQSTK